MTHPETHSPLFQKFQPLSSFSGPTISEWLYKHAYFQLYNSFRIAYKTSRLRISLELTLAKFVTVIRAKKICVYENPTIQQKEFILA